MAAFLMIRYNGTRWDEFDEKYYAEKHLPQVKGAWKTFGLEQLRYFSAIEPEGTQGTLWICECRFATPEALKQALAAPVSTALVGDIKNFTNMGCTIDTLEPIG